KDVKKVGVDIPTEEIDENGLVIASVIDNKENKKKSSKELKGQIDTKLEDKKELDALILQSRKISKSIDSLDLPVLSKSEEAKIKEEIKLGNSKDDDKQGGDEEGKDEEGATKEDSPKSGDESSDIKLEEKQFSQKIKSFVKSPFKKRITVKIFDAETFKKFALENKMGLVANSIKNKYVVAIKINYLGKEAGNILNEEYKVSVFKGSSKAKITAVATKFTKLLKDTFGKNIQGKVYTYRKRWAGDAVDTKKDSLFIFAPINKFDSVGESLIVNEDSSTFPPVRLVGPGALSMEMVKLTKFIKTNPDNASEALEKAKKILADLDKANEWLLNSANLESPSGKFNASAIEEMSRRFERQILPNLKTDDDFLAQADVFHRIPNGDDGEVRRLLQPEILSNKELEQTMPEEVKPKSKSGLFNGSLGWAIVCARATGLILNHGKGVVDVIAAQAMKYKEDKNIIADLSFLLTNGDESETKFSDTKISVRFSLDDAKWHATNLDNRKMDIPENKILEKVSETETFKKFVSYCLKAWDSIFIPKDKESGSIINYVVNNYDKIGLKVDGATKKYFSTVSEMANKYEFIKSKFESIK
ncbi:MAG: hypothetical protein RR812_05765, partial [Vagococcus sp.]